jgi:DNA-binding NtrC family response regulator
MRGEKLMQYACPKCPRTEKCAERALILQQGPEIQPSEFLGISAVKEDLLQKSREGVTAKGESATLEESEKGHILSALKEHAGNYSRTARAIGISLSTLKRKLKKYHME